MMGERKNPHRITKVIATADEPIRFEHGLEYASAEALSDPAHIAALEWLPVLIGERIVGMCLGGHWDGPRRELVADLLVHDIEDMERVRAGDVSEAYNATVDEGGRQLTRAPQHLIVGPTRRIVAEVPNE